MAKLLHWLARKQPNWKYFGSSLWKHQAKFKVSNFVFNANKNLLFLHMHWEKLPVSSGLKNTKEELIAQFSSKQVNYATIYVTKHATYSTIQL